MPRRCAQVLVHAATLTVAFAESMTLKNGGSFVLKYRILVHPGPGDKAVLEKEYQEYAM